MNKIMSGDRPMPPRCALAKALPTEIISTDELKRQAWQEHQTLVVNVNHPELDWQDKLFVKQIGDRLYVSTHTRDRETTRLSP